jgi:hypothetical protein
MTLESFAAFGLVIAGLIAYVPTSGRFMRDYLGRYGEAPPRRWMFSSVDDPEIERWRRYAALSLGVNLVGVMLLVAVTAAR